MGESTDDKSALEKRAIDFVEQLQLEFCCEGFVTDEAIINKLVDLQTRTIMQFVSGGMAEITNKKSNPTYLKTYNIVHTPVQHDFNPQKNNESYCTKCGFHFCSHIRTKNAD